MPKVRVTQAPGESMIDVSVKILQALAEKELFADMDTFGASVDKAKTYMELIIICSKYAAIVPDDASAALIQGDNHDA